MQDEILRAHERKIKARFFIWVIQNFGESWPLASRQLAAITGVLIQPETLRQNIKPSNRKAGKPSHGFRNIKHLRAICDLLIATRYLYESELTDPADDSFAVNALRHLVTGSLVLPDLAKLKRFSGLYVGQRDLEDAVETLHLYVDYVAPDRPVLVSECYALDSKIDNENYERIFSDGWAIWNGEDFHLFLMRSEQRDALSCQVLQTRPAAHGNDKITDLAVLRYQDAWVGPLGKSETEVTEYETHTEYTLSHSLDELCFFLTRITENTLENIEMGHG